MSLRPAVWLVALSVTAVDQATKWWALAALGGGRRIDIFGHYFGLELAFNSGAALSILDKTTWIVTVIMTIVTIWLIWNHGRAKGWLGVAIFGAAMGGALGNLADRLFREPGIGRGEVVDMISYYTWFVGNVADIAIVLAASAAVLAVWRGAYLLEPRPGAEGDPAPSAGGTSA